MRNIILFLLCVIFSGCIKNDIPYPIVEARINALATENMLSTAKINATDRTVKIVVGDSVDLSALRLTRFSYTEAAKLNMPDDRYKNKEKFPQVPFMSLDELPLSADTRVDLSSPIHLTLSTYQDYDWTISATQEVERKVLVDGQVGNAVIDAENRNVIIYVNKSQKLNALRVYDFSITGKNGSVVPDPTDTSVYPDGFDFRENSKFYARHAWEETYSEWRVMVYTSDEPEEITVSVFERAVSATVTINGAGRTADVEYQKQGDASWTAVKEVRSTASGLTAEISGLKPSTTYRYRVNGDAFMGSFTTEAAVPLPNGNLDEWYLEGKLWHPQKSGDEKFWDTGNKGATTIADSNSYPTDDTWNGKGKAACLESKFLVLKFAAGNLFTGEYVRTDGTNGVLGFGRPFTSFPTKLRFRYKYRGSIINRIGDDDLAHLKGQPDVGTVYIILADWDKPFTIKTRKSERSLLDVENDEHIIAYSVMETSESTSSYKEVTLPIDYRVTDRRPKYIVVVASSSKYGDYFVGGDSSCLWIDDMELLYE